MNDWWFFIISDIVGRATLILALLAVFLLFIAVMMYLDYINDVTYDNEDESDRKKSMC